MPRVAVIKSFHAVHFTVPRFVCQVPDDGAAMSCDDHLIVPVLILGREQQFSARIKLHKYALPSFL